MCETDRQTGTEGRKARAGETVAFSPLECDRKCSHVETPVHPASLFSSQHIPLRSLLDYYTSLYTLSSGLLANSKVRNNTLSERKVQQGGGAQTLHFSITLVVTSGVHLVYPVVCSLT